MILSLNEQAMLFLLTVAVGAVIGFFYDVLRIFRKMIPHKSFFIQAEDGLYWVCVVFLMFFIMLKKNDGEIRFFSVCGAFLGMGLYFLAVSPVVNAVSDRAVAILHSIISLFFTILLTPFRLVWLVLGKPVKKTRNFFYVKRRKLLHLCKLYVKINKKAAIRNVRILFRKK